MVTGDTKKKVDISKKSEVKSESIQVKNVSATKKPTPIKTKFISEKKIENSKPIAKDSLICCQEFKPKAWEKKEIKWDGKFFVKDTVFTAFHIPLNYEVVLKKNIKKIEAVKAATKDSLVVIDELSPFHSHIYIAVTKPVVGCKDVKLTGQFLSGVFEGPYSKMKKYIKEMNQFVKLKGKETKKNYFFYPTCPKCSKKYGKNYTVILAEY